MRVFDELDRRYYDAEQGMWAETHDYGICTYLNALPIGALESKGHRCAMFGKSEEAFAGQPWDTEYACATGHDWLVVDDRWLVDLWIKPYLGIDRAVFDLQHPEDQKMAHHIYGPRNEWELADAAGMRGRLLHPELFAEVLAVTTPQTTPGREERLTMHAVDCPPVAHPPKPVLDRAESPAPA